MRSTTTGARSAGGRGVKPARRLFTVDEYLRMGEAGILGPDERVELIEGEILLMTPIGSPHAACVNRFNAWLVPALAGRAIVSVQNPVHLSARSMPQPDLALLRFRQDYYASAHPDPEDILLLIEVSDTTFRYDRDRKLPLYAAAGVPEAWIANPRASSVLIGRDPSEGLYLQMETVGRDGTLAPAAFPDVAMGMGDLFG